MDKYCYFKLFILQYEHITHIIFILQYEIPYKRKIPYKGYLPTFVLVVQAINL